MDNVYFYVRMELEKKYPGMQFVRYQMHVENQDTPIFRIFVDYHDTKTKLFSFDLELADKTQRVIIITRQEVKKIKSFDNLILAITGHKYFIPLIKKVGELACDYLNDPMRLNCAGSNRMTPWKTIWPETNYYDKEPYLSIEGLPIPAQELPEQKKLRLRNITNTCENIWVKMTLQDPPDTTTPYLYGHLHGILSKVILPDGNIRLIFEKFSLEHIYKEFNRLYPLSSAAINLGLNNIKLPALALPSDHSRKEIKPSPESGNSKKRDVPSLTLTTYNPMTLFKDKSPPANSQAPQQDEFRLSLEEDACEPVKRPKIEIKAPLNRTPTQKPPTSVTKAAPQNINSPTLNKSSPVIPATPKNKLKSPPVSFSFVPIPTKSLSIIDDVIKKSREKKEKEKNAKDFERGDIKISFS
jgi:hypothetical protein